MFSEFITKLKLKVYQYLNHWFTNYVADDSKILSQQRKFVAIVRQRITADFSRRCTEYCFGCWTCGAYHALDIIDLIYDTDMPIEKDLSHPLHTKHIEVGFCEPEKLESSNLFYILDDIRTELEKRHKQQELEIDDLKNTIKYGPDD